MSKKTNLINFDKEIALSIGLNESIVLQQIKNNPQISFLFLKDNFEFIDERELKRVLKKLLKLKLILETNKNNFSILSKRENKNEERKQIISKTYQPSKNILKRV